jgi:hypothetical protein
MMRADIPARFYVRGVGWQVIWRSPEDTTWKRERCLGLTHHATCTVFLCESMIPNPSLLAAVWLHELMHACIPATEETGRPKGVSHRSEEKIFGEIDEALANVLNQIGWRKLT